MTGLVAFGVSSVFHCKVCMSRVSSRVVLDHLEGIRIANEVTCAYIDIVYDWVKGQTLFHRYQATTEMAA